MNKDFEREADRRHDYEGWEHPTERPDYYFCNDCREAFESDQCETDWEGEDCCPWCGSNYLSVATTCEVCGTPSEYGLCGNCLPITEEVMEQALVMLSHKYDKNIYKTIEVFETWLRGYAEDFYERLTDKDDRGEL